MDEEQHALEGNQLILSTSEENKKYIEMWGNSQNGHIPITPIYKEVKDKYKETLDKLND